VGDLTVPADTLAPGRARMLRLLHELRDATSDASGAQRAAWTQTTQCECRGFAALSFDAVRLSLTTLLAE
jgi:hypothetical protein